MIITKSWLNEWIDLNTVSTSEIAKTFNAIGLEVDRVHSYQPPKNVVFGRVLSCEKHPDADKLSVCQVDTGTKVSQIVCGAANVRTGLDVVVALIGAQLPGGLEIKHAKLRGVDSEGMICSATEIGLPSIGAGIIEVDTSIGRYTLGQEISENAIFNDDLIEIELTANRGDCLSVRGIARDLCAAFDKDIREYTATHNDDKRGIGRIVSLSHEKNLDVNLRYKAIDLKELVPPLLVRIRLAQISEGSESCVEAMMQYVMHSTGVVLHAYKHDFFKDESDKVAKIILCENEQGFAVIKAKEVASVVGVSQTKDSMVVGDEGLILIEASYIPPELVSKKMAENKIESSNVYYKTSRGSEPDLEGGLLYCVDLIEKYSKSSTFSGMIELSNAQKDRTVVVTKQEIDELIGANIDKLVITKILKNLGFDTSKSSPDKFAILVPPFRHDILNKQDIIEEIVRMVGIDNIPSKPFVLSEDNRLEDNYFEYKKRTVFRHRAASNGFFESVHFVFDEKKVLESYGFETTKEELELLNPIVQTLDTLRPTLLTGLLKAASMNVKNGYASVRLFEIGSVFSPLREESVKLTLLFGGAKEQQSLANQGKPQRVDFAFFVQKIANIIGDVTLKTHETKHSLSHLYQCAGVYIDGESVGELFRVHPDVEKAYDLETTFMCELDFEKLPFVLKTAHKRSKYQASFRDLSLMVPKEMAYETIANVIEKNALKELIRFYPVDRYSDSSLGDMVSLSLRFVLQSEIKTLEEEDINTVMANVINSLEKELGVGLR